MCSPFLRGFLPGIVIGLFTSLLLFSLWRHPSRPLSAEHAHLTELDVAVPHVKDSRQVQDVPAAVDDVPNRIQQLLDDSAATVEGAYDFLVLVHSSPGQRSLRDAVRETWLRKRSQLGTYVARFVIGTRALDEDALAALASENAQHNDLLALPDVHEEANAEWPSSEKLLQSLTWAVSHVNFTALLKCNSATFVDLDQLLNRVHLQRSHVWGYFAGGVKAQRHSNSSSLVEPGWTLCSHYLPYPEGGGYILSHDVVDLVVSMGPNLDHYHHDDIALGVWLSPFKGIVKQHMVSFNSGHYSRGCLNSYLVTHRETVMSMHDKAASLESKGLLCTDEHQSRLAYRYNWTAPLSHCCVRRVGVQ